MKFVRLMDMNKLNLILIVIIAIAGFYFRFYGIEKSLSFWNDEIHTAYFSRAILETGFPGTPSGHTTGLYQIALYLLTALSFGIFGISEFAARLPSVLAGTSLIVIIFLVTKKVTNLYAAYIASILTAFSQIQLAWSTQLRPYIWLEICTLLVSYCMFLYLKGKRISDRHLVFALCISTVASLFHGTGLINFILVSLILLYKIITLRMYKYLLLLIPVGISFLVILFFSLSQVNRTLGVLLNLNFDIVHYRVFLQANYWWLILGSIIGSFALFQRSKQHVLIFIGFPVIIFFIAIVKFNSQYVRYSLPAFPFLYILFGTGVVFFIEKITGNYKNIFIKGSLVLLFSILISIEVFKTNKVLLAPQYYYTINGDMRENPIVDYKRAFQKISALVGQSKNTIMMDAWNDRVPWYMPNQQYIFLIEHRPEHIDPVFGEPMISTVNEFLEAKRQYPSGVVLVENWESQTAYILQQYIRNNLKHEFDVENLPYNEADKWSISIYSWGL